MNPEMDYIQNQALVRKLAWRVLARVRAAKLNVDYDDIYQELSLTWHHCVGKYNPQSDAKFSTYYVRAALNNINRYLEKFEDYHQNVVNLEYDSIAIRDDDGEEFEGELDGLVDLFDEEYIAPHDLVVDCGVDEICPQVIAADMESIDEAVGKLSKDARLVVDALTNPTELIKDNLRARDNMFTMLKEDGHSKRFGGMSVQFVCDIFGIDSTRRSKISSELRRVFNYG